LAFDRNVSLVDMIIAVPAIMLIMNLPVSIGGLGLMEASYTVAFELLGYSAELGLVTALLMRGKAIIDALVGGVLELRK
ncbi:lysylphosphatidylglycerol synthase domain-containing protein, partial [Pseudomonadota bacterium]